MSALLWRNSRSRNAARAKEFMEGERAPARWGMNNVPLAPIGDASNIWYASSQVASKALKAHESAKPAAWMAAQRVPLAWASAEAKT